MGKPEDEFPMLHPEWPQPIPDLLNIPRERWERALEPLDEHARRYSLNLAVSEGSLDVGDFGSIMTRLQNLDLDRRERQARGTTPTAPPTPNANAPFRQSSRQLNLRFSDAEYAELKQAGEARGLRPPQLARVLLRSGVTRILYEERRDGRI